MSQWAVTHPPHSRSLLKRTQAVNASRKYNRTLHAQISEGVSSDDRMMPNGYVQVFAEMEGLVLTEKLDGQNNCLNRYGVFARSHAAPSHHPWDKPLRERWTLIKDDLKDLEVFGENMFGIHSIAYSQLESYFYVFAIREKDRWLSWEEVQFYAGLLDFPTVPEICITHLLKDGYDANRPENEVLAEWLKRNLGMDWRDYVETAGQLGGYDPVTHEPCAEGFVVRNEATFLTNEGPIAVAPNEFNNLFKLVRAAHVKTEEHWTINWKPATLVDYEIYRWFGYDYLGS